MGYFKKCYNHLARQLKVGFLAIVRKIIKMSDVNLSDLNYKLERIQNDLDFVKNHMSSYLGNGTGLTHLIDETPIYINTNDFGCPSNFINGGRYEEEYYHLLASFRKSDSVLLDIGANLGVFSLRLSPMMRNGKVIAFEPNPIIHELFARSLHLNGMSGHVKLYKYGASDKDAEFILSVPDGHAGGASVADVNSGIPGYKIEVKRIDDLLADLKEFHIAKIDVEGHELSVLKGMQNLIQRSPNAVILFEKLNKNSGIERELLSFFEAIGLQVYRVDGNMLQEVNLSEFENSEAYFFATRPSVINGEYIRNFITIYPEDMFCIAGILNDFSLCVNGSFSLGALIAHGPYWYLQKGSYRLDIDADIYGALTVTLSEKFGYKVKDFLAKSDAKAFHFIVERDLTKFEVVLRAASDVVDLKLKKIILTRLG